MDRMLTLFLLAFVTGGRQAETQVADKIRETSYQKNNGIIRVEENSDVTLQCDGITRYSTRHWAVGEHTTDEPSSGDRIFIQHELDKVCTPGLAYRDDMTCLVSGDNQFDLMIGKVQLTDTGFTCVTILGADKIFSYLPLQPFRVGDLTLTGISDKHYYPGDLVTITCRFTGFYPDIKPEDLTIKWGSETAESESITEPGSKYFTSEVVFERNVTLDDHSTEVSCNVNTAPYYYVAALSHTIYVYARTSGTPKLTINPNETTAGTKVTFSCDVTDVIGYPKTVKWTNDLQQPHNWTADSVQEHKVQKSDAGSYACQVVNEGGNSQKSENEKLLIKDTDPDPESSNPTVIIVGAIVGVVAVAIIAGVIVVFMKKHKKNTLFV